jgi:hypothetical protein
LDAEARTVSWVFARLAKRRMPRIPRKMDGKMAN